MADIDYRTLLKKYMIHAMNIIIHQPDDTWEPPHLFSVAEEVALTELQEEMAAEIDTTIAAWVARKTSKGAS